MGGDAFSDRAAARGGWPLRRRALTDIGDLDDYAALSAEERLRAIWQLTCDAWALSGRALPDYERARAPGVITRRDVGRQ